MPNILVCEDDKSLNNLISTVLRNDGHTVITAFNGSEALSQFDCAHIDMLVSDIMTGIAPRGQQ